MKLKRHEACSGCKALEFDRCCLGFGNEQIDPKSCGHLNRMRPVNPCPRPMTNAKFVRLKLETTPPSKAKEKFARKGRYEH